MVVVGGLTLPLGYTADFGSFQTYPDVYLAAVWLSWAAATGNPLKALARIPGSPLSVSALLVLFSVVLVVYSERLYGGATFYVSLRFDVLFYLLLLYLGLSRIPLRVVLLALASQRCWVLCSKLCSCRIPFAR